MSKTLDPPARLDVTDLLVRNPHIQGSNLFVRFRRLLEVGGFDEALASTTDRDICIRLADMGAVEYGVVSEHQLTKPSLATFRSSRRQGASAFRPGSFSR